MRALLKNFFKRNVDTVRKMSALRKAAETSGVKIKNAEVLIFKISVLFLEKRYWIPVFTGVTEKEFAFGFLKR